jgi:tetratricopeptide (TPR) repeat protein
LGATVRFVARHEVLQRLANIASDASRGKQENLGKQLEALRDATPEKWRDGEMFAAFGKAYAQLGNFGEAIAAYQQAIQDEHGSAPVSAAQQMANLLIRSSKTMPDDMKANARQNAFELLNKVAALADTAELRSLRASSYKRIGDLPQALHWYQKAVEMDKQKSSDGFYYPGLNAAAIAYVLTPNESEKWIQPVRDCADAAARQRKATPDIWARAGVVDANLMLALWEDKTAGQEDHFAKAYIGVAEGGGAVREIDSILSQIAFLIEQLPPEHIAQGFLQAVYGRVKKHVM